MEVKAAVVVCRANVPEAVAGRFQSSDKEVLIPLKDLDGATLDRLCDEFREDVFRKAGKTPPPRVYGPGE